MDISICEIARDVRVTETYVHNALRKVNSQIHSFEDSINLLEQLNIIRKFNPPKWL